MESHRAIIALAAKRPMMFLVELVVVPIPVMLADLDQAGSIAIQTAAAGAVGLVLRRIDLLAAAGTGMPMLIFVVLPGTPVNIVIGFAGHARRAAVNARAGFAGDDMQVLVERFAAIGADLPVGGIVIMPRFIVNKVSHTLLVGHIQRTALCTAFAGAGQPMAFPAQLHAAVHTGIPVLRVVVNKRILGDIVTPLSSGVHIAAGTANTALAREPVHAVIHGCITAHTGLPVLIFVIVIAAPGMAAVAIHTGHTANRTGIGGAINIMAAVISRTAAVSANHPVFPLAVAVAGVVTDVVAAHADFAASPAFTFLAVADNVVQDAIIGHIRLTASHTALRLAAAENLMCTFIKYFITFRANQPVIDIVITPIFIVAVMVDVSEIDVRLTAYSAGGFITSTLVITIVCTVITLTARDPMALFIKLVVLPIPVMLADFDQAGSAAIYTAAGTAGSIMLPCLKLVTADIADLPVLILIILVHPAANMVDLTACDNLVAAITCASIASDIMLRKMDDFIARFAYMPVVGIVVVPLIPFNRMLHMVECHTALLA